MGSVVEGTRGVLGLATVVLGGLVAIRGGTTAQILHMLHIRFLTLGAGAR